MKEALFFRKEEGGKVKCFLCNHYCNIENGQLGICGVRLNREGVLYSLNYAELVAANIDPIEKKPLFHFFPGSSAYSIASIGCNFKCGFCQNWQISQAKEAKELGIKTISVSAQEVVEAAVGHKCRSISYTYTEPTIYFEFAYDCAILAKEKGLYNNFVTNGYMSKEALRHISPYLDAANVDLKSFREEFYRKICKAKLAPVLENIALMKELGIWVELTTLIIPGENDSEDELSDIVSFIASLDKNIPWHISCFYPNYKFTNKSVTAASALETASLIGKEKGLKYVYIGNIHTDYGENTYCPSCSKLVIERLAFFIKRKDIKSGKCQYCGKKISGVGL
ncbi:MAG: AmmeMemoRadiSam system radical SAM enzyme [Candidatus Omnitrophota bacterium]|nr:MAG: AmmeMemoRadiSam system radical SAM enzyme [Candidatus Omnitrophota bacterium]